LDNAAPTAFTPAPIIYPFRATYPVGSVAVARLVIPPDTTPVRIVESPLMFALVIIVFANDIPERSTSVSTALARDTPGPTIKPLLITYPAGMIAVSALTSPPVIIPVSVELVKLTLAIFAFVKITFDRSKLERFALGIETPFPRMNPPRTTYPVGMTRVLDAPPVTPPLTTPVNVVRERLAADISIFVNIEFENTHPDKSAPVSWTPVMLIPERSDVIPRINT
jgi:hypothetical protein